MKSETFHLELITPCFCGGAEPDQQAEIRAPSIRGQLRWWFRSLGGFKSLAPIPVPKQESLLFGSTAGAEGQAGKLIVRVKPPINRKLTDSIDHPTPNMSDPEGYLLFPLRQKGRKKTALPTFSLTILWGGEARLWPDILALAAVFGHLGALGFRSRRAMGALAFQNDPPELASALHRFAAHSSVFLKQLNAPAPMSRQQCIPALANWLKSCRAHGRSGQNDKEKQSSFFRFAETDHDIGYKMPGTQAKAAFRPALGLPIIQRNQKGTNNWEWDWNQQRHKAQGRFASPVLLRPHRDAQGRWHALVIFMDAHKWPNDPATGQPKEVFLNGQPRKVSLDLYQEMKKDPNLVNFP